MVHRLIALLALCACLLGAPARAEQPEAVLQTVLNDIQELWVPLNRDPEAGYDSRRAWTQALIDQRFDFNFMARRSLGTQWRVLDTDEKIQYQDLFYAILVETVIDWLDGYDGESFEIGTVRQAGKNTELQTVFTQTARRSVRVTWVAREDDGRYLFRDVRVSGLSLTADFRGTHQRLLSDKGVAGLFARLAADLTAYREQHD